MLTSSTWAAELAQAELFALSLNARMSRKMGLITRKKRSFTLKESSTHNRAKFEVHVKSDMASYPMMPS